MTHKQKIALFLGLEMFITGCKVSAAPDKDEDTFAPKELAVVDTTFTRELPNIKIEEEPIIEEPEEVASPLPELEPGNEFAEINFAYTKEEITLLNDTDWSEIPLAKYQTVGIIRDYGEIAYVVSFDGDYGYIETKTLEYLPDLFVEVDISDQVVKLYKDNELILVTDTVTGAPNTPTREGYFQVNQKFRNVYLTGPTWRSFVKYWMRFDKGRGLHDAKWRKPEDFANKETHIINGSHGCVNLPEDDARRIYETVSIGTRVLVHK